MGNLVQRFFGSILSKDFFIVGDFVRERFLISPTYCEKTKPLIPLLNIKTEMHFELEPTIFF